MHLCADKSPGPKTDVFLPVTRCPASGFSPYLCEGQRSWEGEAGSVCPQPLPGSLARASGASCRASPLQEVLSTHCHTAASLTRALHLAPGGVRGPPQPASAPGPFLLEPEWYKKPRSSVRPARVWLCVLVPPLLAPGSRTGDLPSRSWPPLLRKWSLNSASLGYPSWLRGLVPRKYSASCLPQSEFPVPGRGAHHPRPLGRVVTPAQSDLAPCGGLASALTSSAPETLQSPSQRGEEGSRVLISASPGQGPSAGFLTPGQHLSVGLPWQAGALCLPRRRPLLSDSRLKPSPCLRGTFRALDLGLE